MKEQQYHIMGLTETQTTNYSYYTSQGYLCYFDGEFDKKGSGVGVIINPIFRPYVQEIYQISGRLIIRIRIKTDSAPTYVYFTYAPHQGQEHADIRAKYWQTLTD